jgi:hypothetical protein
METATILVLILSAGVVLSAATWALLGGFEISSSRNEARRKPASSLTQSASGHLQQQAQSKVERHAKKTKAA